MKSTPSISFVAPARVPLLVIGYVRASRFGSDADGQRVELAALGAYLDRVYVDTGLTGMARPRPALGEAFAATRPATHWSSPNCGWPARCSTHTSWSGDWQPAA